MTTHTNPMTDHTAHPPCLIGLTGPAGAGKDAVADVLVHAGGFVKMAFADALRAEVCAAMSVPLACLTSREAKEYPVRALALERCHDRAFSQAVLLAHPGTDVSAPRSPRQILQWWGTEYRRAQSESYWVDRASRRMAHALGRRKGMVITDVRFDNEARAVRERGGVIWQVQRPGLQAVEGQHASAVTGAEFAPDRVIDNSGGLDDLMLTVCGALRGAGVAA